MKLKQRKLKDLGNRLYLEFDGENTKNP